MQIPFLTVAVTKTGDLNQISVEISGSFQVLIGPFSGSIDRLGTMLRLDDLLAGVTAPRFDLKPPSGAGLAIDAGIVKGGGFLLFDPDRGEYGGILDIRIAAIGVKAIGLLSTKNPGGWSLLLIITAQLPPKLPGGLPFSSGGPIDLDAQGRTVARAKADGSATQSTTAIGAAIMAKALFSEGDLSALGALARWLRMRVPQVLGLVRDRKRGEVFNPLPMQLKGALQGPGRYRAARREIRRAS